MDGVLYSLHVNHETLESNISTGSGRYWQRRRSNTQKDWNTASGTPEPNYLDVSLASDPTYPYSNTTAATVALFRRRSGSHLGWFQWTALPPAQGSVATARRSVPIGKDDVMGRAAGSDTARIGAGSGGTTRSVLTVVPPTPVVGGR
jgi:hypothetical protein